MPRYIVDLEFDIKCSVPYVVQARTASEAKAVAREWARATREEIQLDGNEPAMRIKRCTKSEVQG